MNTPGPTSGTPLQNDPADFSLVLGGPLYQLWRRTRLAGDTLQLLNRRIVVLALLAWVPLLLLSVAEGHAWGDSVPADNDMLVFGKSYVKNDCRTDARASRFCTAAPPTGSSRLVDSPPATVTTARLERTR